MFFTTHLLWLGLQVETADQRKLSKYYFAVTEKSSLLCKSMDC